jgi:two-component system, NarL family, response regulator NreC
MVKEKLRILIVEDYQILREGLRSLFSSNPDFEVAGEAGNGEEAIQLAEKLRPHLVLMDLSMPKTNGLTAIREIKKKFPQTKILVLTVHKAEEYVFDSLRMGADGYALKDSTYDVLTTAMKNVLKGKTYISPEITEKVIEGYLEGRRTPKSPTSWEILTPRERQIFKLIGEGYKNRQIADYFHISPKTVEKHRSTIMEKLEVNNTAALVALAIKNGLVVK